MNRYHCSNCLDDFKEEPKTRKKRVIMFGNKKTVKEEYAVCPNCQEDTTFVKQYNTDNTLEVNNKLRLKREATTGDIKRIIQPTGDQGKKDFADAYGYLPKEDNQEKNDFYSKKYNVPIKNV